MAPRLVTASRGLSAEFLVCYIWYIRWCANTAGPVG